MIDALAHEVQFLDHLAPIWKALPLSVRGQFLVGPSLRQHATQLQIHATDSPRPPSVPLYPQPRHDGPVLLVASYGDTKVGRRLGYGPFVFAEHGAGQSYLGDPAWSQPAVASSYPGGPDRSDTALFLVPNDHAATRWRKAYPGARVAVVGSPRLDTLPPYIDDGGEPIVAISFHFEAPRSLGPEANTALGEYLEVLPDLAARFRMIGHAHPKADWPQRMERIYARAGIPFVASFDDVCRRAAVYVCDNSSTIFEFAATDRPVVVLNSRWYRRHIHHGLRFWDAATVGVQVDRAADLPDAIAYALTDPPEQRRARETALKVVYRHRHGAAQRAAAAITEWLQVREAAA